MFIFRLLVQNMLTIWKTKFIELLDRYLYTAWTVTSIKYTNNMSLADEWTANVVGYVGNSYNDSSTNKTVNVVNSLPASIPTTYSFDRPVIANEIRFTVNATMAQRNSYFELRGCDLEGK